MAAQVFDVVAEGHTGVGEQVVVEGGVWSHGSPGGKWFSRDAESSERSASGALRSEDSASRLNKGGMEWVGPRKNPMVRMRSDFTRGFWAALSIGDREAE